MLREDGLVLDDGTVAQLARDVAGLYHHGECSEGDAAYGFLRTDSVAGPGCAVRFRDRAMGAGVGGGAALSRRSAQLVDASIDISNEAFPYMGPQRSPFVAV